MKNQFPSKGEKLKFKGVPEFYYPCFTNLRDDADKYLIVGQEYEIENVIVNSSWVSIYLKGVHNPDVGYNLTFFQRCEN